MRSLFLLAAPFLTISVSAYADDSDTGDWKFSIEPYLQATSISGDASVGRVAGVAVDVGFSDILENLKMAGMLHFEAHHNNGWGLIFDYGFMDLGADAGLRFGGVLDASVRQGILELLASRRIGDAAGNLEVLAGVRWWDNKIGASLDPAIWSGSLSVAASEEWLDPVVGLRWTGDFANRWQLRLRGDVGGFGISSDSSWSASVTTLYTMSDRFVLELGYRALDVDYSNDKAGNEGAFAYDTTTHGPLLGLVITF
jgi:hypothetical protein